MFPLLLWSEIDALGCVMIRSRPKHVCNYFQSLQCLTSGLTLESRPANKRLQARSAERKRGSLSFYHTKHSFTPIHIHLSVHILSFFHTGTSTPSRQRLSPLDPKLNIAGHETVRAGFSKAVCLQRGLFCSLCCE